MCLCKISAHFPEKKNQAKRSDKFGSMWYFKDVFLALSRVFHIQIISFAMNDLFIIDQFFFAWKTCGFSGLSGCMSIFATLGKLFRKNESIRIGLSQGVLGSLI